MTQHASITLAQQLIRCPSITPNDAGCQNILIDRLEKIGFHVTPLRFDDVDNFWATRGDNGPTLMFAGHTDVVPTGDESLWDFPPFEGAIIDGFLTGRGSADMKGSLAAMVVACEEFVAINPNHTGRIGFLITSDEEGIAKNGTVKVVDYLQNKNETIDWCIVGEPSSSKTVGDTIKNGRRGSLGAELTVKGTQGHVAYPHLADNPIHRLAPALAELSQTHWDNGNDFFPATTFQVSNINSGTGATNVIPATAHVIFNFRFSTENTAELLQKRTEVILAQHGLSYDIKWHLSGEPFLTASGPLVEAVQQSISSVTGLTTELSTAGGTSDGRFIAPMGTQVIELGPINDTIHKVNEKIPAQSLETLTNIYRDVLLTLLPSQ